MIAEWSAEIEIAIFQSISERQSVEWRSIVNSRPSRLNYCAFYQRKLQHYWTETRCSRIIAI